MGDFKGRASDFRSAPISPGTSIHARFLKAQTEYPWEGIPLGLFLRETRLTVGEGTVSLGVGKPLNMALYAFLEDMKVRYSVRVRTFDSDAWRKQPDGYSVLSDTTFFLQTDVPPPFGFVTGAYIACVNERSGSAGNPSNPACKESEGGQVIEDPMSETGEPALLMVGRSGLPEWLTKVPTDVCAAEADPSKLPRIAVPEADGRHQEISLDEKFGDRWCIRVTNLNYVAVRVDGIRIGDTLKRRLDSRLSKRGRAWTMLAAEPSPDGTQRIVLYPPASSGPVISAPMPPMEATVAATLEFTLTKDTPQDINRIAKLWYGPWQAGDGGLGKCEALKTRTIYSTKQLTVRPKGEHRVLTVTLPDKTQYNLRQRHALVAQIADGRIYCGIATASASGGLEVALRPEEGPTSPQAKVSTAPPRPEGSHPGQGHTYCGYLR